MILAENFAGLGMLILALLVVAAGIGVAEFHFIGKHGEISNRSDTGDCRLGVG